MSLPRKGRSNKNDKDKTASAVDAVRMNITKAYKCGKCKHQVLDNVESQEEESVECDACRQWYHYKCTELTATQWKIISSNCESIVWKCDECIRDRGNETKQISKLEERIDLLVNMITNLEDKLMARIEEKVTKSIEEKQEAKMQEIEEKITTKIMETIEESEEQEKRKNNLVIVNLTESSKTNPKERAEEDLLIVKDTLKKVIDIEVDDICEPVTLGKKIPEDPNKPRPLKIKVKSLEMKKQILQRSRKINEDVKDPKRRVYVNNDLTGTQREREQALRKELKHRREQLGERDIRIDYVKGKIVAVRPDIKNRERSGTTQGSSPHKD